MKRFILFLSLAAFVLASCARPNASPIEIAARPIKVTTTIGMIADLVQNVGGERVIVDGFDGRRRRPAFV